MWESFATDWIKTVGRLVECYTYLQNPFYCETCYYTSPNHDSLLVHLKVSAVACGPLGILFCVSGYQSSTQHISSSALIDSIIIFNIREYEQGTPVQPAYILVQSQDWHTKNDIDILQLPLAFFALFMDSTIAAVLAWAMSWGTISVMRSGPASSGLNGSRSWVPTKKPGDSMEKLSINPRNPSWFLPSSCDTIWSRTFSVPQTHMSVLGTFLGGSTIPSLRHVIFCCLYRNLKNECVDKMFWVIWF